MPSSPIRALAFAVLFALLPLPPSVLAAEAETLNGVPVEVLAWSTVEVAGGTVTFVRIRPPALSAMPLAALGFVPPWLAAIGMSLSSLCVILNAQRIGRDGKKRAPREAVAIKAAPMTANASAT